MRDRHKRAGRPPKPSPYEPHTEAETRLLRAREALALADYERGQPAKRSWLEIRTMAAIAAALARVEIGPELTAQADHVRRTMLQTWRPDGPLPLDVESIDMVRDLMALAAAQRRMCTRAEYLAAIKSARREMGRERRS